MNDRMPVIDDFGDLDGKKVLLRADLNVPLAGSTIVDDFRIRAVAPTIQKLQSMGAVVTVCSHLGRPGGVFDSSLGLEPVHRRLEELVGPVAILPNLRFSPGEEANDPDFVTSLVSGQDAYINDAFGVSHRPHASVVGPPRMLPSAAGELMRAEVEVLQRLRSGTEAPFVAILGGAKVSDKLGVIEAVCGLADTIVLGGGMAFPFMAAQSREVGASLMENEMVPVCAELLSGDTEIIVPQDIVALEPGIDLATGTGVVSVFERDIPPGWMGVDIGPETAKRIRGVVAGARRVLWNGPMGVYEDRRFATGTQEVAKAVAEADGFTVVGGGDSAAAIASFGLDRHIDYVSTGGGASLEFIEHGDLPGLAALRRSGRPRR